MTRKFSELRERLSPEARSRAHAATQDLIAQMPLNELRRAREMSQQTLAEAMHVPQSAISKIERRTDAYIGTIRRYLEAMGGALRIYAEFPDGENVEITQFGDIAEELVEA
jgi:transcriptional regulator with XRE-family HTH domain